MERLMKSRRFTTPQVFATFSAVVCSVLIPALAWADPPVIDVWYGSSQPFGQNGDPQVWVNILGNVSDVDGDLSLLEYRLNGVHRNPRTVELPQADPIADEYRERFLATAGPILEELENFKTTQLATIAYSDNK